MAEGAGDKQETDQLCGTRSLLSNHYARSAVDPVASQIARDIIDTLKGGRLLIWLTELNNGDARRLMQKK